MTWRTIGPGVPGIDSLSIFPLLVLTPTTEYPTARLIYDETSGTPTATVVTRDGPWETGTVTLLEQADQQWRVTLTNGDIWEAERRQGCGGCGTGGDAPRPRPPAILERQALG